MRNDVSMREEAPWVRWAEEGVWIRAIWIAAECEGAFLFGRGKVGVAWIVRALASPPNKVS